MKIEEVLEKFAELHGLRTNMAIELERNLNSESETAKYEWKYNKSHISIFIVDSHLNRYVKLNAGDAKGEFAFRATVLTEDLVEFKPITKVAKEMHFKQKLVFDDLTDYEANKLQQTLKELRDKSEVKPGYVS